MTDFTGARDEAAEKYYDKLREFVPAGVSTSDYQNGWNECASFLLNCAKVIGLRTALKANGKCDVYYPEVFTTAHNPECKKCSALAAFDKLVASLEGETK